MSYADAADVEVEATSFVSPTLFGRTSVSIERYSRTRNAVNAPSPYSTVEKGTLLVRMRPMVLRFS